MKRINKNGFTMIELLAVITLLGIVMVVAIPNVSRLIEKSKESKMKSNENTLLIATKSYLQANKDQYPKSIGEVKKIEANVLKSSGFLKEDITDGNKKSCMANSYVNVQKKNNSKYSYDVFLICPGDSSPGSTDSELDISGELWYVENGVDKISEDGEDGAHLITKVTLHYKGNGLNLASYSYVVLVSYAGSDDGNYTAIINSDLIKVVGKVQEKDVELDLTGYVDTTRDYYIKVIAKAYDEKGGSKSFETGSRFKNDQAPICGHVKVYDGKTIVKEYDFGENPDFKWVNTPRKVTVECKDNNGSKCKKAKFSQVFTKTGNKLTSGEVDEEGYGYVRIEDNRGRTNDCLVKVNIDTIPPEVPTVNMYKWIDNDTTPNYSSIPKDNSGKSIVYENAEWSKKNVYTEPKSTDAGVGMGYYQYTTTGVTENDTDKTSSYRNIKKDGKSYIKWRACDKLKNCSEYSDTKSVFVAKDYNITYDLDGGVNNPNNPTIYDINTKTITLAKPTKRGYTFVGWSGTGISGTKMDVSIPKGSTGNRSYKAHWSINTMTIYYKASKGEVTDAAKKNGYGLNSDRIVTKNGATYSEIYNYGDNLKSDGLMDYNSSYNFEVKYVEGDISYVTRGGNEWKCISGCDNVGRYYSLSKNAKYKVSDFCNLDDSSCEIVLDVAWVQIIADWRCADDLLDYYIDYCLVDDGENINAKECYFSKKGYFNENGVNENGATIDETGGWIIRGDLNNSRTCFIDSSPGNTNEGYRCKSKSTTLYHIVECSAARCYYDNKPSGITERNNFRGVDIRTGKICVKYNTVTYDAGCAKYSAWSYSKTEKYCQPVGNYTCPSGYIVNKNQQMSTYNATSKRECVNIGWGGNLNRGGSGYDLRKCTYYTRTCLSRDITSYTAGCAVWNDTKEYYCESKD